ncbi:copper ion binding protein [Thermoactinomyces mirandus]|uniref:Heavy-metal-associated domain-containing protein n=1 Tax=Thermoactinomyces mirandus TaxID=2756294 RepID=A0A7W1XRS9_9BACL|nr:copper ion binding protein [Thermoactinomyces mirandus]MBA4601950.1 heavy-metal-associated domain-containing protein [Thermoactinomyces mirandus]
MKKETIRVEGMSCNHCVKAIEGALKRIGVEAKVDLGSGTVKVSYDEQSVDLSKVKETIEDQGYDVVA